MVCNPSEGQCEASLGLYSITFNNRLDEDLVALDEYRRFRLEAEAKGFRHFLEVFDPNAAAGLSADDVPKFVNDSICRTLAGVPTAGRPLFLKVVYHGPRAMEELVSYDPHLVVGILGGGAGTTYDAFKLISEAQKYGARVALFGRKINGAECQLAFVAFLRLIVDGEIGPEEAVKAYHGVLERLKIRPHRSLADDLALQTGVMSYGGARAEGGGNSQSNPHECGCADASPKKCDCKPSATPAAPAPSVRTPVTPDFSRMTQAEKLAYNQERRNRIFGP